MEFNPMFNKKSNTTTCMNCNEEYNSTKSIRDSNGDITGWSYSSECPKCRTINKYERAIWKETKGEE